MPQTALLRSSKSTNVRLKCCSPVQGSLGLLSRLWPSLASRVACLLFTHPHPSGRRSVREEQWLSDALPFKLAWEGQQLAAWSWGDGPTILLHHGWNGRGAQLGAFVQPLLAAGFSVVTYDAPAHGDSPGHFTNGVELARVITLVSRRMHGLHAIVAHSLGCLATAYALRQPLPVERLVFLSPPADMLTYTRLFTRTAGFSARVHDLMKERFESTLNFNWNDFQAEPLAVADRRTRGRQTPLLVVHDRTDEQVPWQHGQRYHRAWEGSQFFRTSHLGHQLILRDREVVERVVHFLSA